MIETIIIISIISVFSFTVTKAKTSLVPEVTATFFTFFIIFVAILVTTFVFFILKLKVFIRKSPDLFIIYHLQELPSREERERIFKRHFSENHGDVQCLQTSEADQTDGNTGPKMARYVTQLAMKSLNTRSLAKAKSSFQSNDMYVWLILTMGISYAIPALQLVLKYQEETDETGNQDICYFNYQCSFPLGALSDFNHFLSNIGYVGFGCAFLIVTKYKSWKYRVNQLTNVIETENGSYIMHKVDLRSQ